MMVIDICGDDPDHKYAPAERMANAIIEHTRTHGGCLPQDLLSNGFTKQETLDHWHMARAMADIELKWLERHAVPETRTSRR